MKKYIVSYNMPGYLPDSDPTEHDSFDQAKKTILWRLDNYFETVEDSDEQNQRCEEIRNYIIETWNGADAPYIVKLGAYVYTITCDCIERYTIRSEEDGFNATYHVYDSVENEIIQSFSDYSDNALQEARALCDQLNNS